MKFYDYKPAPSPRRVRIFIAEKEIELPTVQVDLRSGEQLSPAYRAVNPRCVVPFLVLDDGTGIGEATAICRYFEEIQPDPPLFGENAQERALVAMWDHWAEGEGFMAVAEALRNSNPAFASRALTGAAKVEQIPALAERGRDRAVRFFGELDARLGDSEFVAGPRFTVADITVLVAVDFARWIKLAIPDDHAHLKRWHAAVSARPSAQA